MVDDPDRPDERHPPPDATRPMPPVDRGGAGGAPNDATVVGGQPAVDATHVGEPRWTARAHVPPPGSAPLRQPTPQHWAEDEEQDPYGDRSWLRPVFIGIVVLLLIAAFITGVWLIYRAAAGGGAPGPEPSSETSAAPSTAAVTSAAPSVTSASPTAAPSVGEVTIPALRGDSQVEAVAKLRALGLGVAITQREDTSLSPGQVIDSSPGAGATVAAGQTVTLIVAKAPSPSPSRTTRPPSPSASAGGEGGNSTNR